jgi:phosphoribosylformylglycinamidine synthase subunit PurS
MVTHVTNRSTAALKQRLPGSQPRQPGRIWPAGHSACSRATPVSAASACLAHAPSRQLAYPAVVPKVVIDVMLKPEIHDPQGDAIASACRRLGFGQVAGVRQGKRFEIELTEPVSADQMAELAAELLANPVIEEFTVVPPG